MALHKHQFEFEQLDSELDLSASDRALLQLARTHTSEAYAPYSHFLVAAVAKTVDGEILTGTNQENASYPVGICAERVLLSALSAVHPGKAIDTMAISYHNLQGDSSKPASPCGMCRQSLVEYEQRMGRPMRLILAGQSGKVMIVTTARDLLPFTFTSDDMK